MGTVKSMRSFFFTFLYFHKMEKVLERLFRHFGHALRTQHQSSESFSDCFQARKKILVMKRILMESPLNSFQTP